jgi:Protein of unknown function (DUF3592)
MPLLEEQSKVRQVTANSKKAYLIVACTCLLASLLFFSAYLANVERAKLASMFSQTEGVVESSYFWWEPHFKGGRDTLQPTVICRYDVQNKSYSSGDIYIRSAPLFRFLDFFVQSNDVARIKYDWTLGAEKETLKLTRGTHHTVYFNPNNPKDSFLLPFPPLEPLPYLVGSIGFLCGSILALYMMTSLDKVEIEYEKKMAERDKMLSDWRDSAESRSDKEQLS